MNFTKLLIAWYLNNKRNLPWRDTNDPYVIWLSEIILQQTRVVQGTPYFYSFIESFPTVFDLAEASEEQVLKLWQGLGYYSRARNLHFTAKYVASELNGIFPQNYIDLLKLKGVGEYTAAAVASFAYNEPVPVVDGNVFRVLARFFNVEIDIANGSSRKEFTDLAYELMPKDDPATFNQAIMEFGALQCVPRNPDCQVCPLNSACLALQMNKVNQLPVKSKKGKVKNRYFNYLIASDENENTLIQKRIGKGIWQNLYEFPLLETESESSINFVEEIIQTGYFPENEIIEVEEMASNAKAHKLSHQHLHIKFWKVRLSGKVENAINYQTLLTFPFPIVIFNFIENDWR